MMDERSHVHDLVGAYVLRAITPPEEELVRRHLSTCAACRQLESDLHEASDLLPALAGEATPPAQLRARLLEIVRAEAPPGGADQRPQPAQPPPLQDVPRPLPIRSFQRTWPLLTVAATLAVLVVGLTLWRYSTSNTLPKPTAQYALAGTTAAPRISGSLAYYAGGSRLELSLHGLPHLPGGRVYELWLIRGTTVVKGIGAFRPDAQGNGSYSATGEVAPSYTLVGVTVEKAPLSTTPTLPMVAAGKITG